MMEHGMIRQLAEKIQAADAVLIGGGSGLSSAAGSGAFAWERFLFARRFGRDAFRIKKNDQVKKGLDLL